MEEILKAILETELEDEAKVEEVLKAQKLSEKAAGAVKGALRLLNAYKDELPADIIKTLAGLAGYGYPAPENKADDKDKQGDKGKKDKYGYPPPVKKEDGSLNFEGVPEEVRPMLEQIWKEHEAAVKKAEELEKVLKEERDRQRVKEFVAKAASEFANLPGAKAEEFGPVLKGIAEKAPEEWQKLEGVLKAADQAIRKGMLFAEMGRSGIAAGGSAVAKIEGIAKSLVEKDASRLTMAQAITKALEMHPELYEEYLAEKQGRVS
ncbi:MAG: hypothetical protein H5U02_00635 [Clostridia bacterium]|nr:hypothetical protein [Clostridia bacterium]